MKAGEDDHLVKCRIIVRPLEIWSTGTKIITHKSFELDMCNIIYMVKL
jgi:hypothetical protein